MSIPQKADKWIVFVLMMGLGVVYVLRSMASGGLGAIAWFATPIIFGVVFTTCYVVWCSICHLIARVLRVVPTSANIRLFANGSFFAIMLALIFVPYERTVTIRMPTKDPVQTSADRPPVKCVVDSPERNGEEGCSILASRPLVGSTAEPLYWHIDRFDSFDAAKNAAGSNGVAAEAHGSVWLMTVEHQTEEHHGGSHIASIGPLPLPVADRFTMKVQSSRLNPGSATPVHSHSGPEVWYIVTGEQCLETQQTSHRLIAGHSFVLPSDLIHRGRITATVPRGTLSLVLHDSARPPSNDVTTPTLLSGCK